MTRTRWRRPLLIGGICLAVLVAATATGEIVARSQIAAALDGRAGEVAGVTLSAADGLALWALATGRVDIDAVVSTTAAQELIECRTGRDVAVSTSADGVAVDSELSVRGRSLPTRVVLVPHEQDGDWTLTPRAVVVAGLSLPPERVAAIAGGRAPEWLTAGVPLPTLAGASLVDVTVSDDGLRLRLSAPLPADATATNPFEAGGCSIYPQEGDLP